MALRRMLVPIALQPRDEKLLAYACGLTVQGVQDLIAVHVVDMTGQEAPVIMHEVERAREQLRRMAEPYAGCGMNLEVRVEAGTVFRQIMAVAHQTDVDVICCGTEGKSFIDYLFSGSVSEDVALKGEERTMTVRWDVLQAAEDPAELARSFARRLVIPTDFSASSMRALLSAVERPADALGTVHAIHVLSDGMTESEALAQMRAYELLAEEHGADFVAVVRSGNPGQVVLEYVGEVGATGVITGRRGRSQLGRGLLGSVAMKLLQEAPCPVVVQP